MAQGEARFRTRAGGGLLESRGARFPATDRGSWSGTSFAAQKMNGTRPASSMGELQRERAVQPTLAARPISEDSRTDSLPFTFSQPAIDALTTNECDTASPVSDALRLRVLSRPWDIPSAPRLAANLDDIFITVEPCRGHLTIVLGH